MGGINTGEMGKRLFEKYRNTEYEIYYDHGKKSPAEPHCCEPTPFFGDCSNASALSNVDIAVANRDSKCVELIAEVEETNHEPKTIIGDIVNLLLADQIKMDRELFPLGDVVFVLGACVNPKGDGETKIKVICKRLEQMNEKLNGRRIEIYPVIHGDPKVLVDMVQDEIERQLRTQ